MQEAARDVGWKSVLGRLYTLYRMYAKAGVAPTDYFRYSFDKSDVSPFDPRFFTKMDTINANIMSFGAGRYLSECVVNGFTINEHMSTATYGPVLTVEDKSMLRGLFMRMSERGVADTPKVATCYGEVYLGVCATIGKPAPEDQKDFFAPRGAGAGPVPKKDLFLRSCQQDVWERRHHMLARYDNASASWHITDASGTDRGTASTPEELVPILRKAYWAARYQILERWDNHPDLRRLAAPSHALCTVRFTTLATKASVADTSFELGVAAAFLRIPNRPTAIIDCLWDGAVAVRVDVATGTLAARGFDLYRKIYQGKLSNGETFSGMRIPHWDAACALAKRVHASLAAHFNRDMPRLSVDIALLASGPAFMDVRAMSPVGLQSFGGLEKPSGGRVVHKVRNRGLLDMDKFVVLQGRGG